MFGLKRIKELEEQVKVLTEKLNKETEDRIKSQNERLCSLEKTFTDDISEFGKDIDRLGRIVKHSNEKKPTYYIEKVMSLEVSPFGHTYPVNRTTLYIYVDKAEYPINFSMLSDDYEVEHFGVNKNLAVLEIIYNEDSKKHKYIIDYKLGTYVCSTYDLQGY